MEQLANHGVAYFVMVWFFGIIIVSGILSVLVSLVAKVIKKINETDPAKHCRVFRDVGCSHIDGMLCDFPNCKLLELYLQEQEDVDNG